MTLVSDVFAFAIANAEYWAELVSDEPLPPELNADETAAVAAARAHVTDAVVELFQECGNAFSDAVGASTVPRRKFQRAKAVQNRGVMMGAPDAAGLYGFWFTLEDSGENNKVKLYASMHVKAGSRDIIRSRLTRDSIPFEEHGGSVFGPPFELKKDDELAKVASQAAKQLSTLYASAIKA